MKVKIQPRKLKGDIDAISSKSYAHRILLASALCKDETHIHINHFSQDIKASIETIQALGSKVEYTKTGVLVTPNAYPEKLDVFCHESGTTARLVLPIMAAISKNGVLNGSGSLPSRPFLELCEAMEPNGVKFNQYNLPIEYTGKLQSGTYSLPGDKSSQYISGLMFALPLLNGGSKINLTTPLQSSGYVDITIDVLKRFGIDASYDIKGNQEYISPKDIIVEGDWSNASYWLCAGIMPNHLNENSAQKDKLFIKVCDSDVIDAMEIPDLVPALAVYATQKEKKTKIFNIQRLRIKESDRVKSVSDMITALGGKIEVQDDCMIIHPSKLTGGTVDSCNDHRIVMASAVASIFCEGEVVIQNASAVNKSYPAFFEDFKKLGGVVDVL